MNINNRTLWSSLKVRGATVSVKRPPRAPYTVLKVASLIDTGRSSQTVVLENAFPGLQENDYDLRKIADKLRNNQMTIPPKIANLNCVFTGRRPRLVNDAQMALKEMAGHNKLIPVIPEIIAPGDYVIFRHLTNRGCFKLSGMMRAISPVRKKKTENI